MRSRDIRMVEYVGKKCPGQVNSYCELGFTPLMLAVFTERPEIVKYLLKMKHINTSVPSRHKLTAYDYAREIGQADIERLLQKQ
jgi:ankyrin repeat protein